MKNILILGGSGYIGSRLTQVLSEVYNVDSDDITESRDYHDLTKDDVSKYDAIVLLAGHSSVKSCIGDVSSPWLNNVTNFDNLLTKLNKEQLLIYASSSSVYGNNSPGKKHTEEIIDFTPVNNYDLTKYVLDITAQLAIKQGYQIIGLRFGTVNGWSPNLRTDLMINSMYDAAVTTRQITVTNKHINRALLGIEDLCRAIDSCITNPVSGVYNLASFNTTVDEIAHIVSERLQVPIIDFGNTEGVYDFELDCAKFKNTFNFTFEETPVTIIDGLNAQYTESKRLKRDGYISYGWRPKC